MIELSNYQIDAISKMHNGSVLCGNVGSGKSRTALAYFFKEVCQGDPGILGHSEYKEPLFPRDLYIITTAKKRESREWEEECLPFIINKDPDISVKGIKLTVDSWNNIQKYKGIYGAFFIFDEQRVVGSGAWVKAFLNISRKNKWILLSATPGDSWKDYIPIFIANGYYKNRTEFNTRHVIYSRYTTYPKIEGYREEYILVKLRNKVLVTMKDNRRTTRHYIPVWCGYDKVAYKKVAKDRWDIFKEKPIENISELCYILRKTINTDEERLNKLVDILKEHNKVIIFYNFDDELTCIRQTCKDLGIRYSEWNGQKHEDILNTKKWVYIVQYAAGCEGWNCTKTDTIIFFSQSYSYRMTEQACGRIDRMNTEFVDLYYYQFISKAPIDMAIRKALLNKKNFNERSFVH